MSKVRLLFLPKILGLGGKSLRAPDGLDCQSALGLAPAPGVCLCPANTRFFQHCDSRSAIEGRALRSCPLQAHLLTSLSLCPSRNRSFASAMTS